MQTKPIFEAELDFIIPPKANRYLTGRNGNRYIPERIKEKIDDAVFLLKRLKQTQKIKTVQRTIKLEVLFFLPDKRKRDLDNMMKSLGDCLVKAGIIEDDDLIVRKEVEKVLSKKGKTVIRIYHYDQRGLK